jgi:CxxC motif-containing protein (DUF1111 family)
VCHVPILKTRADYPIPQLANIEAPIFSDLLLHDMGPDFSDGLAEYDAAASEWRTAPLIGLRHLRNYLHDGRAATVEDAILLHDSPGSEAATVAAKYKNLSDSEKQQLLDFVSSL